MVDFKLALRPLHERCNLTLRDKKELIREIKNMVEHCSPKHDVDDIIDITAKNHFPTIRAWLAEIEAERNP